MNPQTIQQYWALLGAGIVALSVLVFVLIRLVQGSARGRLARAVTELRDREKGARKAGRQARKAAARVESLRARGDSAIPRRVEEARHKLEDALALQKITHDQVLIASNQVRTIIVEEFPPKRHEALRRRLLPPEPAAGGPFTMEA